MFAVMVAVKDAAKPCMYAAKRTIKFSRITAPSLRRDTKPKCSDGINIAQHYKSVAKPNLRGAAQYQ
ncbi:hypothetical protein [uncultured Campylobacter sp.]|uniref:hypothetical protein n=1 Tax=uncultured Campylobacter sp. TaxID=218934 RepID=UPI002606F03A|nr:hypothetical protein [uncultured Campylobacter sp.]